MSQTQKTEKQVCNHENEIEADVECNGYLHFDSCNDCEALINSRACDCNEANRVYIYE